MLVLSRRSALAMLSLPRLQFRSMSVYGLAKEGELPLAALMRIIK